MLAVLYSAQTSPVTFFVLTGVLMVFAEPSLRWFCWRRALSRPLVDGGGAVVLIIAYYILLPVPGLRSFF